jgi:hypothetical protein
MDHRHRLRLAVSPRNLDSAVSVSLPPLISHYRFGSPWSPRRGPSPKDRRPPNQLCHIPSRPCSSLTTAHKNLFYEFRDIFQPPGCVCETSRESTDEARKFCLSTELSKSSGGRPIVTCHQNRPGIHLEARTDRQIVHAKQKSESLPTSPRQKMQCVSLFGRYSGIVFFKKS